MWLSQVAIFIFRVFLEVNFACAHCAAGSAGKGGRRGAARAAETGQQADETAEAGKSSHPALSALLSRIPPMLRASCSRLIFSLLE